MALQRPSTLDLIENTLSAMLALSTAKRDEALECRELSLRSRETIARTRIRIGLVDALLAP